MVLSGFDDKNDYRTILDRKEAWPVIG
jgi:hypothetical protein